MKTFLKQSISKTFYKHKNGKGFKVFFEFQRSCGGLVRQNGSHWGIIPLRCQWPIEPAHSHRRGRQGVFERSSGEVRPSYNKAPPSCGKGALVMVCW
jgi:hypothetical protein